MFVPSFKKISQRVSKLLSGHILKFTKGYNSIKCRWSYGTCYVQCYMFEPIFVKVSQRVSELQTKTVGSTLGRS